MRSIKMLFKTEAQSASINLIALISKQIEIEDSNHMQSNNLTLNTTMTMQ
jgi:hypothetical protein